MHVHRRDSKDSLPSDWSVGLFFRWQLQPAKRFMHYDWSVAHATPEISNYDKARPAVLKHRFFPIRQCTFALASGEPDFSPPENTWEGGSPGEISKSGDAGAMVHNLTGYRKK